MENQIKEYEAYLQQVNSQEEEDKGIKDHSVKEVKNICLELKIQFEDLLKSSIQALDYESNSNLLVQTKIANEYLKQEKKLLSNFLDQMLAIKDETD